MATHRFPHDLPPTNNCVSISDVLVEAVYLSVDPYMRAYMPQMPVGITMIGGQVAKLELEKTINQERI